ncbi:MAG: Ig-like domain-containing protein [Bacteroidales bacterium]
MKRLIFIVCASILMIGCATFSGGPAGGPVDTKGPILVHSSPKQSAKNSKLQKISLTFDEYIVLKNMANIVVSPPLNIQYSSNLKELRALILDTLKENTTYTISFNDAIVDLNEGNVVKNLRLVFSTSEVIDSMYLEGKILDALSLDAQANIFVALYSESLDSFPFKNIPNYITKTGADGYFWVQNIRDQCYQIVAFEDKNFDMVLDPITERLAYSSTCIKPKHLSTLPIRSDSVADSTLVVRRDTANILNLMMYQDRLPSAFLADAKFTHRGFIQLQFRYPIDKIKSEIIVDGKKMTETQYWNMAEDRKSANLRWSDLSFNKMKLILFVDEYTDTTDLLLPNPSTQIKIDTFKLSLTTNANSAFLFTDTLRLHSSNPIASFQNKKISVWAFVGFDSTKVSATIQKTDPSNFNLLLPLHAETSYKIHIEPACFTDIYGRTNDTTLIKLICNAVDKYGSLSMQIANYKPSQSYLVQRMDEKNKVLEQYLLPKDGKLVLPYLLPGSYKFRIIEDANQNGRWDGGDFVQKKQAEKLWYYSKIIPVERDWVIEEKWSLTE